MSKDNKGKEKKKDVPEERKGSIDPTDPELAIWLQRLFKDEEQPLNVQVAQVFSRKNETFLGDVVYRRDFRQGFHADGGEAAIIANEMIRDAQRDCDVLDNPKGQRYAVLAYDKGRGAAAYTRYPLKLFPSPTRTLAKMGRLGDDDEPSEEVDARKIAENLAYKYVQMNIEATQWDKGHYSKVFGEIIQLLMESNREKDTTVKEMFNEVRALFGELRAANRQKDEAESLALDREIARMEKKMWVELKKDGFSLVRGLVPGLAADLTKGKVQLPGGKSTEQLVLENFLEACDAKGLIPQLFGTWNEQGQQTAPGLFTLRQTQIIDGVAKGTLSADEVDRLLPMGSDAIDMGVIMKMREFVPSDLLVPIQDLIERRMKAQIAAQTAATRQANAKKLNA